jgi:hypothetical protein
MHAFEEVHTRDHLAIGLLDRAARCGCRDGYRRQFLHGAVLRLRVRGAAEACDRRDDPREHFQRWRGGHKVSAGGLKKL